jgi:hypothetical protein
MIQKIGNLSVQKTEEQESQLWAEVFSHRNKLLSNSDWTQVVDSGLTPVCVQQWRDWRKQLKSINRLNFSDRDSAEAHIAKLSKRMPFNVYSAVEDEPEPSRYVSLSEFRDRVSRYLDLAFNEKCNGSFLDNPYLVDEQFNEAVDFLTKNDDTLSYPLIEITCELYGGIPRAVAEEFVERKVTHTKKLVEMKQKYFYFQRLVSSAATDVELSDIQAEIKKWIST